MLLFGMSAGGKEVEEILVDAKIVSVQSVFIEEQFFIDEILTRFKIDGASQLKMFISPPLVAEDIRLWRRIVLTAVTGVETGPFVRAVNFFKDYKQALINKPIQVAWVKSDIWGIGKDASKMFYPELLGLWGEDTDDAVANLHTMMNTNVTDINDATDF